MPKKKIIFVVGSLNQTTQMHQISTFLSEEFDCYFTQFYPSGKIANWAVEKGFFDKTIWAGKFKADSEAYLLKNNLKIDYKARAHKYALAVMCTDMYIPKNLKNVKKIWVQEGMVDPVTFVTEVVKKLKLPRYLTFNTSLNGCSNECDIFFAASEGYADYFENWGTERKKIVAIGIPNYDNSFQYRQNNFPHKNYVMVATSDLRETMRVEDRPAFLKECVSIASGKKLIFKLHPNENQERAISEIKENCPEDTLVFTSGDINHMIANCDELITQYSTVVYTGIALGKKVHSFFDINELKKRTPVQNGGISAHVIAETARMFIKHKGEKEKFIENLDAIVSLIIANIKEEELVEAA